MNESPERADLPSLFLANARLALTSFGGGVSGLMHVEFVRRRRWLTEEEFLSGLAVAQALPGVNVANLAIWIGYRCRGAAGSAVSLLGVVVPPAFVIVALGAALLRVGGWPPAALALAGVAAAAMGLSLGLGWRAARHAVAGGAVPVALLAATLAGSGLLNLPAPLVVAALAPIGIGWAFAREGRDG